MADSQREMFERDRDVYSSFHRLEIRFLNLNLNLFMGHASVRKSGMFLR